MTEKQSTPRKRAKRPSRAVRTKDPKTAHRFVEELSWLLESYSHLDFRTLADTQVREGETERNFGQYASKNPNTHFLVGTLPIVFANEKFFPSNEDIAEFASVALELAIPRWDKRSRYELIGLIVCETPKLDDERLERLVSALSRVVSDDRQAEALIRDRKNNSLNWNEVIQKLNQF